MRRCVTTWPGWSRSWTRGQLGELVRRVEAGLAEGACGVSTGLHYVPGLYADVEELCAVGDVLAATGRAYVTHMRGYEAEAWIGMDEVRQIATRSGVAVHVSHYHGPANMLIELVEHAREDGVDVTFDSYPYLRGFSLLTLPLLPSELQRRRRWWSGWAKPMWCCGCVTSGSRGWRMCSIGRSSRALRLMGTRERRG